MNTNPEPVSFQEILIKTCKALVNQRGIAVEQLTQDQLASAFAQAIASGDFVRHVIIPTAGQNVVYIPYHEATIRQRKIDEMISLIQKSFNALMFFNTYAPGVNSEVMTDLMPKLKSQLDEYCKL